MTDTASLVPPRPRRHDPEICLAAARELFDTEITEWCAGDDPDPQMVGVLAEILRTETDGYGICRELEHRIHIDPDADLVDHLSGAWSVLQSHHERAVADWVAAHGVTLDVPVGASVRHRRHGDGTVVEARTPTNIYLVHFPEHASGSGYVGTLVLPDAIEPVESSDD